MLVGVCWFLLVIDFGMFVLEFLCLVCECLECVGIDYDLFYELLSNFSFVEVYGGVRCFEVGGYDVLIVFGGGSVFDVVKGIVLLSCDLYGFECFEWI